MNHEHTQPPGPPRPGGFSIPLLAPAAAVDPICGMTVDPAHAAGSVEHEGRKYYFCSPHCVQKFRSNPQAYLSGAPSTAECPARVCPPGAVEYYCPMVPDVVSDHPG